MGLGESSGSCRGSQPSGAGGALCVPRVRSGSKPTSLPGTPYADVGSRWSPLSCQCSPEGGGQQLGTNGTTSVFWNERCRPLRPQGRAGENVTSLPLGGTSPVLAERGIRA